MGKLFGTDGIRGAVNTELTPELAMKLGMAATHILTEKRGKAPRILIGMDTRRSGDMLEAALVCGITAAGGCAVCAGVIPTPAVAYLVKLYGLDAGVVISASHNPFFDNGIKIFDSEGYKLSDETENEIEALMGEPDCERLTRVVGGAIGIKEEAEEALNDYIKHVRSTSAVSDFSGISVALDCANGAAYEAAPVLFFDLGANVSVIANEPNGENINLRCGSTHMEALQAFVKENKPDIGIAFDGDGDRCLVVDETGEVVDGDQIMSVLALHLKENGRLAKDAVVVTLMSNMGFVKMCEERGINIFQTKVGDKYVLEKMLQGGYVFGGEQSGHIINLEHSTTGDGLLTAVTLVSIMKATGKKLSELNVIMEKYPQVLINARVSNERKNDYLTSTEVKNAVAELEKKFEGRGRAVIRPSGTEPLVRVMIEGRDMDEITREAQKMAELLEDVLE